MTGLAFISWELAAVIGGIFGYLAGLMIYWRIKKWRQK